MRYYQEIKIFDLEDVPMGFVWQKLMEKVHESIVGSKENGKIGISFPGYKKDDFPLGNRLRVFANERGTLENLNLKENLKHMADYMWVSEIRDVPKTAAYAVFKRKRDRNSVERLARRYAKRHGISEKEAMRLYKKARPKTLNLPYFKYRSRSTGQTLSIFVEKEVNAQKKASGSFSSFGLSVTGSVPDF